jgi:hypothetical protein
VPAAKPQTASMHHQLWNVAVWATNKHIHGSSACTAVTVTVIMLLCLTWTVLHLCFHSHTAAALAETSQINTVIIFVVSARRAFNCHVLMPPITTGQARSRLFCWQRCPRAILGVVRVLLQHLQHHLQQQQAAALLVVVAAAALQPLTQPSLRSVSLQQHQAAAAPQQPQMSW